MYQEIAKHKARGSQLFFSVMHDPAEVKPYCIQYMGAGHYFDNFAACVMYAVGRKWITYAQASKMLDSYLSMS